MEIEKYNAAWLQAWTDKNTEQLLTFYAPSITYKDNQTAAGIVGHDALREYLNGLFAATPPMRYDPGRSLGDYGRVLRTLDLHNVHA